MIVRIRKYEMEFKTCFFHIKILSNNKNYVYVQNAEIAQTRKIPLIYVFLQTSIYINLENFGRFDLTKRLEHNSF